MTVCLSATVFTACGGNSKTPGSKDAGKQDGPATTESGSDTLDTSTDGTPVEAGADSAVDSSSDTGSVEAGLDAPSDGPVDAGGTDAPSETASAPCPDELGAFTVMTAGAGCGDLAAGAPQCIQAGATSCQAQLVSQGAAGSALNGTVSLDMSGSFASGAVKEGSVQRTGCTGAWNAAMSQLTVDCGGVGSSQSCVATLVRTSKTCAAAPPCPDELGAYTVMITGAGCGDLAAGAPQCIKAGATACQVQLASQGTAGSALNGTVDLDMSGSFASGAVKEGSGQRTGCTGTWNATGSQLTVDCGGVGSSQSCIATLTRTGTCP
jgi:hypothetical protein